MNESNIKRIAFALKCKPEEVPVDPQELKEALEASRAALKVKKAVKHGEPIH